MRTKIVILLIIQLLTLHAFGQIGSKAKQNNTLTGSWQNNDAGFANTLIINQNGSGEFNGDALTYKIQGSTLIVSMNNTITNYSFLLNGNKLTLSGGDLQAPMVFTRPEQALVQNTQKTSTNAKPDNLIGTWNGNNEVLVFINNTTMSLNGYQLQYAVNGNNMTIQTNNGAANYTYEVKGNTLTVNMNGQVAVYQKAENGASPATTGVNTSNSAGEIKGQIAMELVGKWCWVNVNSTNSGGSSSSICITINADGTYTYYGESSMSANSSYGYAGTASQNEDRGTWRLNGNTLNVMSQSQGFKAYAFQKMNHPKNNDPMIVIDGQTFVTYYQKAPW